MNTDNYTLPDLSIENNCKLIVAGVDEAGRGPWAGPVVAAAAIINEKKIPAGINDSKKISAIKRELIFEEIIKNCQTGVGVATVEEIDEINILQASLLAMKRAVENLPKYPEMALIDGNKSPNLACETQTIIKGDTKSLSIAAASIVAKVTRDRIMRKLDIEHPHYLWAKNSGYGTKAHVEGINKHGITKHHRRSFKPIALRIANS